MKKRGPFNKGKREVKDTTGGKKVFLITLGVGAAGVAAYLAWEHFKKRKVQQQSTGKSDTIIINNTLPASTTSPVIKTSSSVSDSFPLKRGSRGTRVAQLQQALANKIGASVMNANGGVDGIFGPGTANALRLAGYGEVIDEGTFNLIVGKTSLTAPATTDAMQIASDLFKAASNKNLDGVLSQLKKITSVSEYIKVNEHYKKVTDDITYLSRSIVSHLLGFMFKYSDVDTKDKLRDEFRRMGLKQDDKGDWTLSGVSMHPDIITLRETFVIDSFNNRIPVKTNTILGEPIQVSNGMTLFKALDHSLLQVPTQDVKHVN